MAQSCKLLTGLQSFSECLRASWTSPVYGFYGATPKIIYVGSRRAHLFKCLAKGCTRSCRRFLDKGDVSSTGNLRRHVKKCWGEVALNEADEAANINEVREHIVKGLKRDGKITASFEQKQGKVTYSHHTHTRAETRYVWPHLLYALHGA